MYPDQFVSTKDQFPTEPHWVIMKFTTTHVAGDERSQTNPGHGYPAHTVPNVDYRAYLTEEKLLRAIEDIEKGFGNPTYVVFKSEPLTIEKTLSVSVS